MKGITIGRKAFLTGCALLAGVMLAGCNGIPGGISPKATPKGPVDNSPPPEQASLDAQILQDIPTFSICDFINREYCLFPFPNDYFTVEDDSTDTGRRVNFSILATPRNVLGKPIDPTEWNRNDGFSPGQAILARVPDLDATQTGMVPLTNLGDSFRADQPIVVIDADTLERHLIWAEIDVNISKFKPCDALGILGTGLELAGEVDLPGVEQLAGVVETVKGQCDGLPEISNPLHDPGPALTIRPAANFKEGHRYIVALRNLKDGGGAILEAPVGFRIYRDNHSSALPMVNGRRAHFESLFETLGKAGIERESLYLTWDFTVASGRNLSERVLSMRDQALAELGDTTPGDFIVQGNSPVISDVTVSDRVGEENIAREVRGIITVPSYLNLPNGPTGSRLYYKPDLNGLYGDGLPDRNPVKANQTFNFLCRIPRRAFGGAEEPAQATAAEVQRMAMYGHGLLGSKSEGSGQVGAMIQEQGFIYCATDWIGMASHDADVFDPASGKLIDTVYYDPPLGGIANLLIILTDFSQFPTLADRVQQSLVNFTYLGRAMLHADGFCKLDAFKVGDQCLLDRNELFYDGNSQGGIIGGALVAISPDIKAGVLGVVGMNYSTLLQRSVDFDTYATFAYSAYQGSLDQQMFISMVQMLWDRAENNGYAQHMNATDPYPNTPPKRVLLHPAFGDHQVTMTSAEVMARSIGASLHCPAVVGGTEKQRGPAVQPGANLSVIAEMLAFPEISFGRRHHDDEPYYGIPCMTSPHKGSALVVWDSGPLVREDGSPRNDHDASGERLSGVATPPVTNTPPRPELGYGADPHEYPRSTAEGRLQKSEFLKSDGAVVDTCGGKPCVTRGFKP